MRIDHAHTPAANRARQATAKQLARWCYDHGIAGGRVLAADRDTRRAVASAAGVAPPHESEVDQPGETWHLVAELLARRILWDAAHDIKPPRPRQCIDCVLANAPCPEHGAGRCCRVCTGPLHRVFVEDGHDTHPCCDPSAHIAEDAPITVEDVEVDEALFG